MGGLTPNSPALLNLLYCKLSSLQLDDTSAQDVKAYLNRGMIFNQIGLDGCAASDFSQVIKINPKSAEAYVKRGSTYGSSFNEAISDYNIAIKINPKYAQAYIGRAMTYIMLNKYAQAIADFDQAIKINPNDFETYKSRAFTYSNYLKQYEKALADLNQSIKIKSKIDSSDYELRAEIYGELKQYDKSIADYTQYIKMNSHASYIVYTYLRRATIYVESRQ